MSFAVMSDAHANLVALEAVLKDMAQQKVKAVYFLGDAVGYGPDPNECTELLQRECDIMVCGNHDWAALGLIDLSLFNPMAKAAIEWTADVLMPDVRRILDALPLSSSPKSPDGYKVRLVHSTPKEPEAWNYLFNPDQARESFGYFKERICFIGHSHVPFVAEHIDGGGLIGKYRQMMRVEFKKSARYIINVGSVGQPRDGDPAACYALLDGSGVSFRRIAYDVQETQRRMRQAGLPEHLINRLSLGR